MSKRERVSKQLVALSPSDKRSALDKCLPAPVALANHNLKSGSNNVRANVFAIHTNQGTRYSFANDKPSLEALNGQPDMHTKQNNVYTNMIVKAEICTACCH